MYACVSVYVCAYVCYCVLACVCACAFVCVEEGGGVCCMSFTETILGTSVSSSLSFGFFS